MKHIGQEERTMRRRMLQQMNAGEAWTPANLPLLFWGRADSNNNIYTSGRIEQLTDLSGKGHNLSQATAGNRPEYIVDGLNDLPTMLVTGIENNGVAGSVSFDAVTDKLSSFAVGIMDSDCPAAGRLISFWSGSGNDGNSLASVIPILRNGTNNQLSAFRNGSYLATTNITTGTPFIFGTVFDGANVNAFLDGSAGGSSASSGNFSQTGSLDIFHRTSGTAGNWKGKGSEIVTVQGALSVDERQKLEGYLAHEWGLLSLLPAEHPYKSSRP
jgi:hypothetical protein